MWPWVHSRALPGKDKNQGHVGAAGRASVFGLELHDRAVPEASR